MCVCLCVRVVYNLGQNLEMWWVFPPRGCYNILIFPTYLLTWMKSIWMNDGQPNLPEASFFAPAAPTATPKHAAV